MHTYRVSDASSNQILPYNMDPVPSISPVFSTWVCLCYTYLYVYVFVCVWICMDMNLYVYEFVRAWICMCICMHSCICMYSCICRGLGVCVHVFSVRRSRALSWRWHEWVTKSTVINRRLRTALGESPPLPRHPGLQGLLILPDPKRHINIRAMLAGLCHHRRYLICLFFRPTYSFTLARSNNTHVWSILWS